MYFNLIIFIIMSFFSSCSKQNSNEKKIVKDEDINEIVFEALSVRTSLVDGENTVPASILDFATLQPKQSGTQDLIITNGLSSSLVFGSSDIDASNISPFVMTETCSNKTIARNRSCKLTFTVLNNPNPTETVLTKSLTIKGSVIQLSATLAPDLTPLDAPIVSLIVSPTILDFGLMKNGEQKELSIAVTNRGTNTQTIAAPVISNPKISITSNTCSSLARNRSCSIKVRYTASNDESISQQSFTSIANNDIKYSVLVQSPTVSEPQVLAINPQSASSSLNLNEPQIQNSTMNFTNTGTVELPSPVQAIAQPSTGVTINSVSCTGGLSRGRTCSVSYSLNSALLAGGSSSVQLRLQSGTIASNIHTINLNVTKLEVPCTIADVQSNGWNTENYASISGMKTGSDVSQCVVQSCNQYFSLNSSAKACQADACTVDNATNFGVSLINVSTVSGNTPNCVVSSCSNPSLFDISPDQKSCVDKPLDCTLADAQSNGWNINNAQTVVGMKIGSNLTQCDVSVCNTNFSLNSINKTCDAISCTLANASGNGVASILNVSTVSGNLPNCSVSSCNANYKPTADSKSCIPKLCNELNASELSALEFNTTNATIAGTYPSCTLSCNSNFELAPNGKSCLSVTYQPIYSQIYSPCSSSNACDGTGSQSAPIAACQKFLDGQAVSGGELLNCSSFEQSITQSCQSPSGTLIENILGGTLSYNCGIGQTTVGITPLVICDSGFTADQVNLLCIEDVIIPTTRLGEGISDANNVISSSVIQSDGKIIIVGNFTGYGGTIKNYIARLNGDGLLDKSFGTDSGPNSNIIDVALQSDGKIIIVGNFTTYNGIIRNYIARLNSDGSLDLSFDPGLSTGATNTIYAIAVQSDGKILIGGDFTTYNGISINRIARLNSDGSLDTTFNPGTGASGVVHPRFINEVVSLPDGKILIGGAFTTYNGASRNNIARINSDGSLDTTFNPGSGASNSINTIVRLDNGKYIIGGVFAVYNGASRGYLARILSNGDVDSEGFNNSVSALALQSNGKIIVAGSFLNYKGVSINRITRLNTSGTIDSSFNSGLGANSLINSVVIQSDGKIIIGGAFTTYDSVTRNRIARLNSDGSLDTAFTGGASSGTINSLEIQSDGKIVIGGSFITYNSVSRVRFARLNSDSSIDPTFVVGTGFNNIVTEIVFQSNGKMILGGQFTNYNGAGFDRIIRLNDFGESVD